MSFTDIVAPYFVRRDHRLVRDVPFEDYCRWPAVNASLLREPTAYQMRCRLEALHALPDSERAFLELTGADTTTAIERVAELTPRTVPRMFAALIKSPSPADKPSAAQLDLCNSLASGPVDCREFTATTLKKCVEKGWVNQFAREVAEDGVSAQVRESRAVAFTTGRAVHAAILEPHRFDTDKWQDFYQLSPSKGLTTKAALEALSEAPYLDLITPEIVDTARRCRDAVAKHKEAARLLSLPGASEVSGEVWDSEMQAMRKVRIDRLPDDPEFGFLDVKTTKENLLIEPIRSAVYKNGYHIQFAYYADTLRLIEGKPRKPGFLIAVTKEAPFICRLFEMVEALPDVSFPEKGRDIYQERLAMFVLANAENAWTAYEDEQAVALTTK